MAVVGAAAAAVAVVAPQTDCSLAAAGVAAQDFHILQAGSTAEGWRVPEGSWTACAAVAVAAVVLGSHRYGWGIGVERALRLPCSGKPDLRSIATGRAQVQTDLYPESAGMDCHPSGSEAEPKYLLIERTAAGHGPVVCRAYRMDWMRVAVSFSLVNDLLRFHLQTE